MGRACAGMFSTRDQRFTPTLTLVMTSVNLYFYVILTLAEFGSPLELRGSIFSI
jgi:hypothetical protein